MRLNSQAASGSSLDIPPRQIILFLARSRRDVVNRRARVTFLGMLPSPLSVLERHALVGTHAPHMCIPDPDGSCAWRLTTRRPRVIVPTTLMGESRLSDTA